MKRRDFIRVLGLSGLFPLIKCGSNDKILDASNDKAPIVVLYPTNTISAYDLSRGSNLYQKQHDSSGRAARDRIVPYIKLGYDARAQGFIDWLGTRKDADQFRFITDRQMDDFANISGAKLLIVIGHSEYWTRQARLNLDHFINSGGNLAWLSADMGWQVRYDGDDMVCYKNGNEDPEPNAMLKTTLWSATGYGVESTLGASYEFGGQNSKGYQILKPSHSIFRGIDKLYIPHLATEFDGFNRLGIDTSYYQFDIIAYGQGYDYEADPLVNFYPNSDAKFQVILDFQRYTTSGRVINVCSVDWCKDLSGDLGVITGNIIELLMA